MILLLDIGNTHTHAGLALPKRIVRQQNFPTAGWHDESAGKKILKFLGRTKIAGAVLCSVVPRATLPAKKFVRKHLGVAALELNSRTAPVGIDYPQPAKIGADRLANAIAVRHRFGVPAVVVDFGTAVTFDVVDARGNYAGGIIAPGLSAMTDYLHEKTALLPKIKIRDTRAVIGKSTEEAMLVGAVHGYRGLIRELLLELKRAMKCRRLPVVATGGYAKLISARLPEITAIDPLLTLDGLRLAFNDPKFQKRARA